MKSDLQLESDVLAELEWDPAINASRVAASVKDGVVTLSGQVDTYLQKQAAEAAVRRVAGARGLAVELEVRLAPEHRRADAEIAQAALQALAWHSQLPPGSVKVEVEDGWLTLTGELDWGFQSANAEQAIRSLIGVRGITNRIRLRQRADPQQLRQDIAAALARHAQREAGHLHIDVDGGVVTLSGQVHSLAEHDAAIGVAYSAKGVTRVVDQLQVA